MTAFTVRVPDETAAKLDQRVATISLTHDRYSSAELAERLGRQGIFAWHGNYLSLIHI